MSSFAPQVATLREPPPDPSKHVNYTLGMVLGVDDFTQEFAYLAGRNQWLARDLLGYGTVCGLQVTIDSTSQGPRVAVGPGTAISPQGQLIRVTPAQCAFLNDWLAANKQAVLDYIGSPVDNAVTLYVVLCYRDCPTNPVPIPGEPCRSEDEMMAPSRLKDDFILELRFTPPDQREEDAVRDFVAWLSQIEITHAPSTVTLDEFIAIVRQAAMPLSSPPSSPPDFMYGSPPAALHINATDVCAYVRAALRLWVTELRPLWLGKGQSCGTPPDEACLLLAELYVPIVHVALTGAIRVDDTRHSVVHEERRPYLLSLRLLQEWLMCGRGLAAPSGPQGNAVIVAAGRFDAQGNAAPPPLFASNMQVTRLGPNSTFYLLRFGGFRPQGRYVVKGTVLTSVANLTPQVFEVIPAADSGLPPLLSGLGLTPNDGIVVRVRQVVNNAPISLGFTVEISEV